MFDRILGPVISAPVRAGRPGTELGARVDLVVSAGVRDSWRRLRGEPLLRSYRAAVYREFWSEAAAALGATVLPRSGGVLEIRLGSRTTWVQQQEVALDPGVTLRASLDKALAYELLETAGIPLPDHVVCNVRRLGPALRFLREHGCVVVKPADGTGGGIGVTASVRTELQLRPRGAPGGAQGTARAGRVARARPRPPAAVP